MADLSLLKKPLITEKSSALMEHGVYTFAVRNEANKVAVKQAFESLFGEKVKSVRIVHLIKKTRLIGRGKVMEKRASTKKAIVTLVSKKKIDIFTQKASSKK